MCNDPRGLLQLELEYTKIIIWLQSYLAKHDIDTVV